MFWHLWTPVFALCVHCKSEVTLLFNLSSQIFIHMLPPYLGMLRPKVETPLSLETMPRREKKMVPISKVADEYFIRKPDSSILFPKPNRWDQTHCRSRCMNQRLDMWLCFVLCILVCMWVNTYLHILGCVELNANCMHAKSMYRCDAN